MKILIPSSSYPVSNVELKNISISNTTVTGCSMVSLSTTDTPMYYQLKSNCFPIATPTEGTIVVILGNIINPSSTKPPDSWEI